MELVDAINSLDPLKDEDWTSGGAPSLASISDFLGRGVTRKEVTEKFPEFNRDAARELKPKEDDASEKEKEGVQAEAIEEKEEVKELHWKDYDDIIAKLRIEKEEITKKIEDAQKEQDRLYDLELKNKPKEDPFVEHLRLTNQHRLEEAKKAALVAEITGKLVRQMSPLDQSLAAQKKSNQLDPIEKQK